MTLIRSQYLGRLCPLLKSTRKTLLEVTTQPTGAITLRTAGALATTPATLDYGLNGGVIVFLVACTSLRTPEMDVFLSGTSFPILPWINN
jgi:hypothetical protein